MFKRNSRNTPVYMLAQGTVTIEGTINVNSGSDPDVPASTKTPGPGGFYGGTPCPHRPGFGPGGGQPESGGQWVGSLSLVPLIGGSGGGGYTCGFPTFCCEGGGGGGAIVIASSTTITTQGSAVIMANATGCCVPGSGGAIRLVANSINAAGSFQALGANPGVVRFEGGTVTFNGSSTPAAGIFTINSSVAPSAAPLLRIASIAGFPVPSHAGGRFDTYDLLLPTQLTDPLSVVVEANNIPVGTQVRVGFVNGSPNATSTSATLAGTLQFSTGTATISNLNRLGVTYLLATATFEPPLSAMRFNPKGRNQVAKIQVESVPGAKPKVVFLRRDGTVVEAAKISKRFLEEIGL